MPKLVSDTRCGKGHGDCMGKANWWRLVSDSRSCLPTSCLCMCWYAQLLSKSHTHVQPCRAELLSGATAGYTPVATACGVNFHKTACMRGTACKHRRAALDGRKGCARGAHAMNAARAYRPGARRRRPASARPRPSAGAWPRGRSPGRPPWGPPWRRPPSPARRGRRLTSEAGWAEPRSHGAPGQGRALLTLTPTTTICLQRRFPRRQRPHRGSWHPHQPPHRVGGAPRLQVLRPEGQARVGAVGRGELQQAAGEAAAAALRLRPLHHHAGQLLLGNLLKHGRALGRLAHPAPRARPACWLDTRRRWRQLAPAQGRHLPCTALVGNTCAASCWVGGWSPACQARRLRSRCTQVRAGRPTPPAGVNTQRAQARPPGERPRAAGARGRDQAARRLAQYGKFHVVADRQVARRAAGERGEVEEDVRAALARADEAEAAAAAVRRRLQRLDLRGAAGPSGGSATPCSGGAPCLRKRTPSATRCRALARS